MMKNYFFFVDDNIWVFRDLTNNGGDSLFDNPYLSIYKRLHDKYGMKVQLNLFYQTHTGDFNLSQMTDRYKEEWKANSDWLRLSFHARSEFPDFPYVNASYDEAKKDFSDIKNEIIRFAGEECLSFDMMTHWGPMSGAGCKAFRDEGAVTLCVTSGDCPMNDEYIGILPKEHVERLMQNREAANEAYPFPRIMGGGEMFPFIRSYNHFQKERADKYKGTRDFYYDEKTDLYFKAFSDMTLNLYEPDRILEILQGLSHQEFIGMAIHEQYFYKDYFNYQPNFEEKIETALKYLTKQGYKSVWMNELLKETCR